MYPKHHIIFGAIIAILIYLIFPQITILNATIIFLASVLIDFDHYLYYFFTRKTLNLKTAFNWFSQKSKALKKLSKQEKAEYQYPIMIFHGIEFWLLLILLSFLNDLFFFILLGIAIHIILDFIEIFYYKFPIYIKLSQIYLYFENKNKKEF